MSGYFTYHLPRKNHHISRRTRAVANHEVARKNKKKRRRKGIPGTETSSFRRAFRSAWKTSEPSKKGIAGIRANERKGADGTHLFYVPRPSERFNAFSKQTSSLLKRLCYLFKHTIRRFARGTFL